MSEVASQPEYSWGRSFDKAMGKVALSLMAPERAVVPMTDQSAEKIAARTRGDSQRPVPRPLQRPLVPKQCRRHDRAVAFWRPPPSLSGDASVWAKCIEACPSTALANTSPDPQGVYDEAVASQTHRFWEDTLAFDFGNCISDRTQKADLPEDYACARCEAICAARGIRKPAAEMECINNGEG